jgi:hypothetical protein
MKRGATPLPPEPLPPLAWVDALLAEMERRIGVQAQAMRASGSDPALKHLVITDAEVDALLAREQQLPAEEEPQAGSLFELVLQAGGDTTERLLTLQQRFELLPFEVDVVLACLVLDIDRRFERLYAYLNDDLSRPRPSADVLLRLLAPRVLRVPLHQVLSADARLLRCALLQGEETQRGMQAELFRVSDGVARWLLERFGPDAQLARARLDEDVAPLAPLLWSRRREAQTLATLLTRHGPGAAPQLINLHGRNGSGRRFVVESACAQHGFECLALDGRRLRRAPADFEPTLVAALRDARLAGGVVFLHHADICLEEPERQAELRAVLQPWLRNFGGIVLFGSETPLPLAQWFPAADAADIELPLPDMGEREAAWQQVLAVVSPLGEAGRAALAGALASKFRMTPGEIAMAAQQAQATGARGNADTADWSRSLHAVVSRVAAPRLHQLAEPMPATHELADLVLPADKLDVLGDIVRRVKHRRTVLEDWRFDAVSSRGRGLVALFHGASGTGKTMAADAIANALHMQLFRIDLAGVVSKYIGETEKNLRAIFDEADRADAVLFFDEADALFGKRSEVKDAHDRYANIEINYLLQRIELFEGIAILATNKRAHLDEAFLRRIHVTLEFPLPRSPERVRLWDRSFPAAAPLAGDIDWDFLAQRFELTGGAIRNAALGAAYLAAEAHHEIGMREVVNALRTELIKVGKRVPDSEFAPFTHLLTQAATGAAGFTPRARTAAALTQEH